jgi:hypothetical protein
MKRTTKLSLIIFSVAIAMGGFVVFQKQRAGASQRRLAEIVPEISAVTLYDLDGTGSPDSNTLAAAISAAFPVNVFSRAASAATCKGGVTIWKGSTLAVITMRDGTHWNARLSHYGGFFTVDGLSGRFVAPGADSSEFQQAVRRLVQEQFVPKRHERNISATPNETLQATLVFALPFVLAPRASAPEIFRWTN